MAGGEVECFLGCGGMGEAHAGEIYQIPRGSTCSARSSALLGATLALHRPKREAKDVEASAGG